MQVLLGIGMATLVAPKDGHLVRMGMRSSDEFDVAIPGSTRESSLFPQDYFYEGNWSWK